MAKDFLQQEIVLETDAARFDDDIGLGRSRRHLLQRLDGALVDDNLAPFRRIDIAIFLPVVDVGFVKRNVVAFLRQSAQQATIIGGGAVPVSGNQARSVKGDFHSAASLAGSCPTTPAVPH